jgi:hypothetical protein
MTRIEPASRYGRAVLVPGYFIAGCVLSVPVRTKVGIIDHKGLLGDRRGPDGLPTVIHSAKFFDERVVETSMNDYALMSVGPISSEGFPGGLAPGEVLSRARSQIEKPWRLWDNCEHFIAWAHGVPEKSPQLRAAVKKTAKTTGLVVGALVLSRFMF